MDYNIHKICRICLEEGALTSIFSTEFAMMPSTMIMLCAKIRVYKSDGLPAVICNNCIYRLGVAYHFKQECENSDIRLRQYLGLSERGYGYCDAQTNTDETLTQNINKTQRFLDHLTEDYNTDEDQATASNNVRKKRRTRYQRKPPDQHKKRGPKPLPKLPQTCYECQKTFKCAAQLQMHMRTHTGEKPYGCSYCTRRFAQKYNLRIHERTHTGERPFQCEICSKQFSALGNFQAHQKIHTGIRDQLCPVCQKAFYSAGDLSKHMLTHTAIKQHACHVCGKTFSRQRDMQAHKRKVHGVNVGTTSVVQAVDDDDVTDDEVAVQVGVNSDTVTAVNVSDCFKCPDCNKEFSTSGSLSVHFRTHASGNLLNLPPAVGPPPPPPHHAHYATATPMHHMHDGLHHTHHLGGGLQTAANVGATSGMSMSMGHHHTHAHHHHATMTHMLPHAPPPPPPPASMHAQRLHPY